MSDIAARLVRARVITYYDTSYPADILEGGPPPEPPETPVLDALDPASIVAGGTGDLVTVSGQHFTSDSAIWSDEEAQVTTFVADTALTYMAQADQAGTQTITVHTGELVSNAIELTVSAAAVEDQQTDSVENEGGDPHPDETTPDDPPSSGGSTPRRRRQ